MKERVSSVEMADVVKGGPEVIGAATAGTYLLADPSEAGGGRFRRAFEEAGVPCLHVVPNVDEVIAYLRGGGIYINRAEYPMPDAVLLDLNLPGEGGFEVLGWIRNQARFQSLKVVLLTGANRSADADRAHQLGADYYVTKPEGFDELVSLSRCLNTWLGFNQLLGNANSVTGRSPGA